MKRSAVIIGAGLAGLSAALKLSKEGFYIYLVSSGASERAQSVMAEGGINAALNTKGENDSPKEHFDDTLRAGCFLASESAVKGMTEAAPEIVKKLKIKGVQFNLDSDGNIDLRSFGGQKKKRTAFAKSDTGKQIMTVLIDEARSYERQGCIIRYMHHSFVTLIFKKSSSNEKICAGCIIRNDYTGEEICLISDALIITTGGMHGLFGDTTGSKLNTGEVTAELFRLGVPLINPEFIQYHPTTIRSSGKRMLVSEAARGEGGRLFANEGDKRNYFMEEKYPELKNLMPRDITAREIWNMQKCFPVYLDISELDENVIRTKLSAIADDCMTYLNIDVYSAPIPVEPGIHYFMGGLYTDDFHRTNIQGLFAAGECAALYHGANRLGGNSLLGAIYGGNVAAQSLISYTNVTKKVEQKEETDIFFDFKDSKSEADVKEKNKIQSILSECMGVVRDEKTLQKGLIKIQELNSDLARVGEAMCIAALNRRESRGAHYREDYPETMEEYRKSSLAEYRADGLIVDFC